MKLNSAPQLVAAFNRLPIRQTNGTTVYVSDVANVRDGYAVQTNIVRHNGARAALLTVLKNGGSSTLDIVARIKEILPRIRSTLPAALNLKLMFDQSIFVRAAIQGVLREATIAALLTGLMILLFLGSWRSTIVVCVSIPLSILTSLAVLNLMGETINVMTLGGLALAVGILVDDATVEIENIHRNLGQGKAHSASHSGWRHADRHARLRFHAVHLHRVRAGDFPDRRGALSVHAAGAGGGAGDDGVVPAFAHAGADHGAIPAARPRWSAMRAAKRAPSTTPGTACSAVSTTASRSGSRTCGDGYRGLLESALGHRKLVAAGFRADLRRLSGAGSLHRAGLFPAGGCRPDSPARARSGRHAHRRDRSATSRRWRIASAA